MQYQEKRSLATIIGSILLGSGFGIYLFNKSQDNNVNFSNDLEFWGKSFLIFMGISIVALIAMHILFVIFHVAMTGEEEDAGMEDERDKIIELKTSKISQTTFVFGFLVAMIFMAMGKPVSYMFISMMSAGFFGGIVEEVIKIVYYRYGDVFKICSK